ncbi:hypothetical protein [uncultured Corynebacterium sp.]|uniref:hypothetical protein n=1 Tax=uncultured Corynebacterium sp. TaxID=159447 RepID=UPI002597EF35|nr:hypothetical protein [uncultured Corynebacterium sp.]
MTAATPTSPVTSFGVPTRPEARVFHQVRCLRPADRRRIQTTLGLSQPSVTRHVAALIDAGFVEEAPARDTQSVGRPRKQLLVDGRHLTVWGAHIGVRNSVLTVADAGGRILRQRSLGSGIREPAATDFLTRTAAHLQALGHGLPAPAHIGIAFSSFVDARGHISSPEYQWDDVPATDILSERLGRPITAGVGVEALAGHELAHNPISDELEDSRLYFYARNVLSHAWAFHGRVHRPSSGRMPAFMRAATVPELGESAAVGQHPLSVTALINACHMRGHHVRGLPDICALARHDASINDLLTRRATALAQIVATTVDVVNPRTVVLAGDTFSQDPVTTTVLSETLSSPGLRLRIPRRQSTVASAVHTALAPLWADPLGNV